MSRRLAGVATAMLAIGFATGGCEGGDDPPDVPGGGRVIEEGEQTGPAVTGPAAQPLRGRASGVEFNYQGGSLRVDIGDASDEVRDQLEGEEAKVTCGSAQASRNWPAGQESLGFTMNIEPVEEDPQQAQATRCRLETLASADPLAEADMSPVKGEQPPAGAPSGGP